MATTTTLDTLVINYLTQAQYDAAQQAGTLNSNQLYLTPDIGSGGGGTLSSVGISNATNGGLSVSGSPLTSDGSITIGHSNVLTSAQTTQAVYPIAIDKNGHVSSYGSAVTINPKTTWYGTSSTAAGTQTKSVTCNGFTLETGAVVCVTFTYANTYSSAKIILNVNSTGNKDVYYNNAATSSTNTLLWNAGETVIFVYSGSYYYFVGKSANKLSAFVNDSGFITSADVPEGSSAYTGTISAVSTTASSGSNNGFARGDHVHNITSSTITSALGYTPYNSTNPNGYVTTDENLKWTASTSSNTYYPLTSTSTATTSTANTLNGISYYQYYNTAGGYRRLDLGNSTAYKTSGGAYGTIRLYGAAATYYGDLVPGVLGTTNGDGHISANRTWTLPDKTGTIALTSDIPTVNSFLETTYPVGSTYTTSTNTNPGTWLGGTWTLIDKSYKYQWITSGFTFNSTNVSGGEFYAIPHGHSIAFRLTWTFKIAVSDNEIEIGTLTKTSVGITATGGYLVYPVPFNDMYNAIGQGSFNFSTSTTAVFKTYDWVTRATSYPSLSAGNSSCVYFVYVARSHTEMLDSFCDQFVWERTA